MKRTEHMHTARTSFYPLLTQTRAQTFLSRFQFRQESLLSAGNAGLMIRTLSQLPTTCQILFLA